MIYILGGTSAYAFVIVNYPSGATVTCTNTSGSKNLSSTKKLFYVKKGSTSCVATISQSGKTSKSTTISSISEGTSHTITLAFETVLYQYGNGTSGWTKNGGDSVTFSENSSSQAMVISSTDYEITYVGISASLTAGDVVKITGYNPGATSSIKCGIISSMPNYGSEATFLASTTIDTSSSTYSLTVPSGTSSGTYLIVFSIKELDKSDDATYISKIIKTN